MPPTGRRDWTRESLADGVRKGDTRALARAIGQLADDGKRFFQRGRSVPQLDSFFVRYDAATEAELKEIERHDSCPLGSKRDSPIRSKRDHPYFVPPAAGHDCGLNLGRGKQKPGLKKISRASRTEHRPLRIAAVDLFDDYARCAFNIAAT